MTVETFGVTADSVRAHHFPHLSAFSASTSPSSTTVGEMITVEAARLTGALFSEAIPTSAIVSGTAAYAACQGILRLCAARRCLEAMTGADPALAKRWDAAIDAWFKQLEAEAGTFLGNSSLSTLEPSNPDGPTTHIDEYELDVSSDTVDPSPATTPLRKDDVL